MSQRIREAFESWKRFCQENADSPSPGLIVNEDIQSHFSKICLEEDLNNIISIGTESEVAYESILNIIILHGGYFRLLRAGLLTRSNCRHLDSLYHGTNPHLFYNTNNKDINAPWITLSAQEVLLDLDLGNYIVVEYGSGMSTFFFESESLACYSFEDDCDDIQGMRWSEIMDYQASRLNKDISLIKPKQDQLQPIYVVNSYWKQKGNLLISIDGIDRVTHLNDWAEFIRANKDLPIIIMIDNSEIKGFNDSFKILSYDGASIFHHYGYVYGSLIKKQCTSFITYRPELMVEKSASPSEHDQRWGALEFQY